MCAALSDPGLSGPAEAKRTPPPLSWRHGLTLRLALVTLIVALVVGLAVGGVELVLALRAMKTDVADTLERTLGMIRESAAEAAYQLNPGVATKVVEGLARNDAVASVLIQDNFGDVLAHYTRPVPEAAVTTGMGATLSGLFAQLFQDVASRREPLVYTLAGGGAATTPETVGLLEMRLSPLVLGERYRDQTLAALVGHALRAVVISALLALVFLWAVIRPVQRITAAIVAVDPARPGTARIQTPEGHHRDELGHMAGALASLMTAFQHSLDDRDRATTALEALTADLEDRVIDRTRALEEAMTELSAEKEETERAFRHLDRVHHDLERANRLVLESIHYARRIQTSLLPDKAALGDAVRDIHVCWEPLDVVGGDYFWLEKFTDGTCLILVADCTGHGVPGAFMTLVVASALDTVLHEAGQRQPSAVLKALDEHVRRRLRQDRPDSESDDGLEAAVCLWRPTDRRLTFAGAGLPLIRIADGRLDEVRGDRACLGYRSLAVPERFTDHDLVVEPGTAFYLITDGIPDHMGGAPKRLLGRRRLGRILLQTQGPDMARHLAEVRAALDMYRGDEPRRDDMTMIGFVPL